MTRRVDDLVLGLCGSLDHPLAPFLRAWCQASRPFLSFVEAHASKIRKKVRLAQREDEAHDLLTELACADLLLRHPRFTLVYEPTPAGGARGPDFLAVFRTHTPLHVEVTRLRPGDPQDHAAALKLARVVQGKLGQLPPGGPNLLFVGVPQHATENALASWAATALKLLGAPPPGLQRPTRHLRRLSAIALCPFTPSWTRLPPHLWHNPQASHPLPPEVARFLTRGPGPA